MNLLTPGEFARNYCSQIGSAAIFIRLTWLKDVMTQLKTILSLPVILKGSRNESYGYFCGYIYFHSYKYVLIPLAIATKMISLVQRILCIGFTTREERLAERDIIHEQTELSRTRTTR